MKPWEEQDIRYLERAEAIEIAPLRRNGSAYRKAVQVWSVVVNGRLYVRAYAGPAARWYQAALEQRAGILTLAGIRFEVSFEPAAGEALLANIDRAYSAKFSKSIYLYLMLGEPARSTTMLVGRAGES